MNRRDTIKRILYILDRHNWLRSHNATEYTRIADLALDTIDRVVLAMELEDEFRVTIAEDVEDGWQTIADIAATIEAQQQANATAGVA